LRITKSPLIEEKDVVKIMEYFVVGFGGMLGSITRYMLGKWISERVNTIFPIGTLLINISGAFLLGIVITIYTDGTLYLLLAEGYLGAFTTFSTFMYEGFNLFQENERKNALLYVLGTLFIGILGFIIGVGAVKIFKLI
jgi:CrcB protein